MPIWRIDFNFDGYGSCTVEADTEEEARDRYDNSDYDDYTDEYNDHSVTDVTCISGNAVDNEYLKSITKEVKT